MRLMKGMTSGFAVFVVVLLFGGAAFEDGEIIGALMLGSLTFIALIFLIIEISIAFG